MARLLIRIMREPGYEKNGGKFDRVQHYSMGFLFTLLNRCLVAKH